MQRLTLGTLLVLMMASAAYAQSPDTALSTLLERAVDADAKANFRNTGADKNKMLVYIGNESDKILLCDITFRIDDQVMAHYEYNDLESDALQKSALHNLTLPALRPGKHRLRIDFHTVDSSQKRGGLRRHGELDQTVNSGDSPTVLMLDLTTEPLIGRASLELHELSTSSASMMQVLLHAVDFLLADRRYFSAASALRQLQFRSQEITSDQAFRNRLSTSMLGLGLTERGPAGGTESDIEGPDQNGHDIDSLVQRYNQAVALLRQDKFPEGTVALETLGRIDTHDVAALSVRDQANLTLGYYFLNHHQGNAAIPVFNRILSPGPCANPALLGLGWALLMPPSLTAATVPTNASDGHSSRRFPTLLTPRLTEDIVALRREQPPIVPTASKDQQSALRRALVPWTELVGRDPTDPAVQEGLLAVAWSLYQFGAYEQAAEEYLRAADLFDKTHDWLEAAIRHVRDGRMTSTIAQHEHNPEEGWHWLSVDLPPTQSRWWLGDTPEAPGEVADTFYLERLLLSDEFTDALQDFRTLQQASDAIESDLSKPSSIETDASLHEHLTELHERLSAAIASQKRRLEELAIADLERQNRSLEPYRIEARFALAAIYDRPVTAGAP